jgi:PleD family two-component response regulator
VPKKVIFLSPVPVIQKLIATSKEKNSASAASTGFASVTALNRSASTGTLHSSEVSAKPLTKESSPDRNNTQDWEHYQRMCILDDKPNPTELMEMLSKVEGIDAAVDVNSGDAVAQVHKTRPHVIVTDYMMSRMKGGEMDRLFGSSCNTRRCLLQLRVRYTHNMWSISAVTMFSSISRAYGKS